ncbi:hypothetical protein CDS [Bradyrhizobium sp.]|nr:hypothetical protein CDS [Bradyrhizobium sp.]
MTTLQQTIAKAFLADLASNRSLDDAKIEALRKLLTENSKIKADDLVKIFSSDHGVVT